MRPPITQVLFNIGQPALNQLKQINDSKSGGAGGRKRRSVIGAAGIGSALSLAMIQSADAVSEIGQLADGRGNLFLLPLFPALGWVSLIGMLGMQGGEVACPVLNLARAREVDPCQSLKPAGVVQHRSASQEPAGQHEEAVIPLC